MASRRRSDVEDGGNLANTISLPIDQQQSSGLTSTAAALSHVDDHLGNAEKGGRSPEGPPDSLPHTRRRSHVEDGGTLIQTTTSSDSTYDGAHNSVEKNHLQEVTHHASVHAAATMAKPVSHSQPIGVERLADRLDKPLLDNRSYKVIKLPNQLEALLVHDADADTDKASKDVNIGNFSEMKDLPGIAHAVEHLLFMGTEKVRLP
jgi:hypothetical protein